MTASWNRIRCGICCHFKAMWRFKPETTVPSIVISVISHQDKTISILRDDMISLQWRHNGRDSVSNLQPHDCLLNPLFKRRSKKTSKLRVTGLCAGNSPMTGEFPAQMASDAENVSIWWRHHVHDDLALIGNQWYFWSCVYTITAGRVTHMCVSRRVSFNANAVL